jgi:hypothetical protein
MGKKVVIFNCEDWVAVYVDGELWAEEHSLSDLDFIKIGILAGSLQNIDVYYQEDEEKNVSFTEMLIDVKMDLFYKE